MKFPQGKITKGLIIQIWNTNGKVTQEFSMAYPGLPRVTKYGITITLGKINKLYITKD